MRRTLKTVVDVRQGIRSSAFRPSLLGVSVGDCGAAIADVHQPLSGILNQLAKKIGIIPLGDLARKANYGIDHRDIIRCRRLQQPQTTKKRSGRQPGREAHLRQKAPRPASYTT